MNLFKKLRESYTIEGSKPSIRKFSKLIGIAYTRLSELERGIRPPSAAELKKYHFFFKVSYEYLLGETDKPTSADVFPENPTTESIAQTRLRMLQETTDETEKEMLETLEFLIGSERGLLILFYLTQWRNNREKRESLEAALDDIKNESNTNLTYTELRMLYDK